MPDISHGTLVKWVNDSEDTYQDSRANSEKCRDYYDSDQITPEEHRALTKRKQAPVVINRIKPKIDGLRGMEQNAKTTCKAYPRTPKHEEAAEASSEAVRFVLQDNHFAQVRSECWENLCIEGTCGADVIVRPRADGFKIIINYIPWDRLIWDQHSRRKDFSDARWLGQVIWMDYDEAASRYPDGKAILEAMEDNSSTFEDKPKWMDQTRRRCKIVEMYYKEGGEVYYCAFTRGGFLEGPKLSPYKNEEGETEWAYEFASLHVRMNGDRYGAVRQLLDVQDEINKRRSRALHLMSVRQIRLEKGAVEDVNKVRQELSRPDGVVETTPGMEFEVLKTGDMATAQFQLLAEAKMEIDMVGVNAALQGKDQTAVSGVALRARQSSGMTEVGPQFDVLKWWTLRIYRKVWNRIRQYWKEEKWIRVTDDEQNLRWVGLNKPVTKGELLLQEAQGRGLPPEQLAQLQAQIAQDPLMQEVVETKNDVADLDVDIVLSEVPDVLTAQIEDFQVLGEMIKSGFPMPPAAVIEASPLSNKDKILKMMKESPQIPPQMQEQMKKLQEEAQKLAQENQQLKSGVQEAQMKLSAHQQEMAAKLDAQLKIEEMKAFFEKQAREHEAEVNARIARMEALIEAETDIETTKIDAAAKVRSAAITAAAKPKETEDAD